MYSSYDLLYIFYFILVIRLVAFCNLFFSFFDFVFVMINNLDRFIILRLILIIHFLFVLAFNLFISFYFLFKQILVRESVVPLFFSFLILIIREKSFLFLSFLYIFSHFLNFLESSKSSAQLYFIRTINSWLATSDQNSQTFVYNFFLFAIIFLHSNPSIFRQSNFLHIIYFLLLLFFSDFVKSPLSIINCKFIISIIT